LRRVSRVICVDFTLLADTGSIVSVVTLEKAKEAVGFRYPNAAFALSWRSDYLANPGWRRATLDVWKNAKEQSGDYLQERVIARLINESDEPPGPDEKLDGNQLPSDVPTVLNPGNIVEREGISMLIVPVLASGEAGPGATGPFWCFVIDKHRTVETPPRRQKWTLMPVDDAEGNLIQFDTFKDAVDGGFGEGELRIRGKV
jgi:hypothetical protein